MNPKTKIISTARQLQSIPRINNRPNSSRKSKDSCTRRIPQSTRTRRVTRFLETSRSKTAVFQFPSLLRLILAASSAKRAPFPPSRSIIPITIQANLSSSSPDLPLVHPKMESSVALIIQRNSMSQISKISASLSVQVQSRGENSSIYLRSRTQLVSFDRSISKSRFFFFFFFLPCNNFLF